MVRWIRAVRPGAVLLAVALVTACELVGGDTVARAGAHRLTVADLAQLFADWKDMPLRDDMLQRWSHRWVEYTLAADRLAAGDSLLDSATVVTARWPDVAQILTGAYRDSLVAQRLHFDSAAVDSAYTAGDIRIIDHILIAAGASESPAKRAQAKAEAQTVRRRLMSGIPWAVVNRQSDDSWARMHGGSLGVVKRGETIAPFEDAAFALDPGEISPVVETEYGYHVIRRPPLAEVRAMFRDTVRAALVGRLDSALARELDADAAITVSDDAPAVLRQVAEDPLTYLGSDREVARYDGRAFTVSDVLRWLRALPPQVQLQMGNAADEDIEGSVRRMVRQEALVSRALDAGMTVPPAILNELRFQLRRGLSELRESLKLDSALAAADPSADRRTVVDSVVWGYLNGLRTRTRRPAFVPTFLSDLLREQSSWSVNAGAFDRVIQRARAIRSQSRAASGRADRPTGSDSGAGAR